MEKFIQFHLEELQSQQETRHLVVELSSRITDHQSRVCQVLCSEPLRHPEVALLVLVGMAANQPLESNFFPGLLEGLLGGLALLPLERVSPPHIIPRRCWLPLVISHARSNFTDRAEGSGDTRICRVASMPGSKSEVIRCQQSSQTLFSSLAWLMWCTRHSSLQWCRRPFPPLVATRFCPSQVSQRTADPNQRCRS